MDKSTLATSTFEDRPIPKPLMPVFDLLGKLGCKVLAHRWSYRGVPHIVLEYKAMTYSVCYFGKHKTFRVFYPYPSNYGEQFKHDCTTPEEVVDFIKEGA